LAECFVFSIQRTNIRFVYTKTILKLNTSIFGENRGIEPTDESVGHADTYQKEDAALP